MRDSHHPPPAPCRDIDLKARPAKWPGRAGGWLWLLLFITCVIVLLAIGDIDGHKGWLLLTVPAVVFFSFVVLFAAWIAWVLVVRRGVLTWLRLARAPAKALVRGDRAEAERALARALARAKRFSPQDRRRGLMLVELAGFVKAQGRYSEAKALFDESVAILSHRWRSNPLDYFIALNNYAVYFIDLCDHAAAQRILEQILDLTLFWQKRRQASRASSHHWVHLLELVLHMNLVVLFVQMQEVGEAADHMEEADAIFPRLSRRQQAKLGDHFLGTRALLLYARGQFASAARELDKAKDASYPMCLHVQAKLALVRLEFAQAEHLLRQCFDREGKKGSLHRPDLRDHTLELAESLFGQGKHDEAFATLQDVRAMVADFAMPPTTAWRKSLASWLQRARELHRPDQVALLEADLQKATDADLGIVISPRLRIRRPTT
jgi:tetratricopeptide (TPR) repeat protein